MSQSNDSLIEKLNEQIAIHQGILDSHSVCPRDFHHGAIKALQDAIKLASCEIPYNSASYRLSEIWMNELQSATWREFLALVKHGAKSIDIHVRKDAKEYTFQADFLKHVAVEDTRDSDTPNKPVLVDLQKCANAAHDALHGVTYPNVPASETYHQVAKAVLKAAMVNMEYLANENTRLRGALEEIRRRMVDTPDDLRNEDGETDYWEYSQDGILEFIDTTLQPK